MAARQSRDLLVGLFQELISIELDRELAELPTESFRVDRSKLDPAESANKLSRYVYDVLVRALSSVPSGGSEEARVGRQVEICNRILEVLRSELGKSVAPSELLLSPAEELLALIVREAPPLETTAPERPSVPLDASALLVNAPDEPSLGREIEREIASADRVDLLCAFIRWYGFRILRPAFERLIDRGGKLRVLTTTYIGATERHALEAIVQLGGEVKVAYERENTRLHAKAWLLHRRTGFSTAYVGSSNLSKSALLDGLEWNVRLSQVETPHLIDRIQGTFESYWSDERFESFDPSRDAERFDRAVQKESPRLELKFVDLDLQPRPHQRTMLYELEVARELHDEWRNLVVAATGTGKTVLSALDYRRLRRAEKVDSLLFVAHRKEILEQSVGTFRTALRDGDFGELYVGGARPKQWKHVFASVQSLAKLDPSQVAPDEFDMVIVDEFHHAAAPSYRKWLDHLSPKVLLGLTATPERADGQDVREWFHGKISSELRLWTALEQCLLSPFQYFGVHDDVDLSGLVWKRGGYDAQQLENIYTGNDARVAKILEQLSDKVADLTKMRALGFCVSVAHASYMARKFTSAGIPSEAISGETLRDAREGVRRRLVDREINVIFSVDLFNEGVDIPEVDTVLFLRPTESATVFLQQLGRGLRLHADKACLTVLDFIGHAHRNFRFDLRYRALSGATRTAVKRQVEGGFPFLPAGCHMELDRVAQELVLENIRQALGAGRKGLVAELKRLGDVGLAEFLRETGVELADVYRGSQKLGWTWLRRDAGLETSSSEPEKEETGLFRGVARLLHVDDRERLELLSRVLGEPEPPALGELGERELRLLVLFMHCLWDRTAFGSLRESLQRFWDHPSVRAELQELLPILEARTSHLPVKHDLPLPIPMWIHCHYTRLEILAAFGASTVEKPKRGHVSGVHWDKPSQSELLFVTLKKSDREFSPTTRYRDYAISRSLFHWESQSATRVDSKPGQRLLNHREEGTNVLLFIRETTRQPNFFFCGPAHYVSHEGERPIAITWRLEHELPEDYFHRAAAVAG